LCILNRQLFEKDHAEDWNNSKEDSL
jgi:hypothetical protein